MRICKKCGREIDGKYCKPCNNKACVEWRKNNPNYSKEWRKKNPEKERAKANKYRMKNPEVSARNTSKWYYKNKEKKKLYGHSRRAAKAKDRLSYGIIGKLYKLQNGKCACCGEELGNDYHIDHIIPIALGGMNVDSNIQLLTKKCNLKKGSKHPIDYMQSKGYLL